jgi:heptosyltransferase-2
VNACGEGFPVTPTDGQSGTFRRIAVFCPNLIGDAVMATPALRALRAGFAGARIALVVKPHVAPVFDGAPWFDERILFAPRAREAAQRTVGALLRLRALAPDLAVVFPNSLRSAWMAVVSGARRRIGYSRGGRGLLLTDRLAPKRDAARRFVPTPAVEYYLAIVRRLGCRVESVGTELFTTRADEAAADGAWERLGLFAAKRVVCLNTGGAFGPAKNWPNGSFVALARRLVSECGVSVVVLCGPAERENARAIARAAGDSRVVSLADEALSIGLSKACVRRAALLVTTDSGPRHFAGAFGVPVVSLFGPTHMAWTRTYRANALHLQVPVPCGPCQKPVCREGHHRCMRELDPDAVFAAAARLLSGGAWSRGA